MSYNYNTPKIYVGTYHKYNCGSIQGKWLELDDYSDKDEFYEACAELHSDEEDPELMFQDWENIPECWVHESGVDEKVWDWICCTDSNKDALEAYLSYFGDEFDSYDEIIDDLNDKYHGDFSDELDPKVAYAEQLFDECYASEIPDNLKGYIDYEKFARDLFMDGYVEVDGHIFNTY